MSAVGAISGITSRLPLTAPAAASSLPPLAGAAPRSGDAVTHLVQRALAANPLASLDAAIDSASAGFSFDPRLGRQQRAVPGAGLQVLAGNALSLLAPATAATMSLAEFVARSQSSIADAYEQGLAARSAGGAAAGHQAMADALSDALRRDAQGMTSFDHQELALELEKQRLLEELRDRVGNPAAKIAELMSITIAQGTVRREREKHEELLKLIISLLLGVQIPQGTVERLVALGLGPLAEELISQMVGEGKHLSRSMLRQLQAFASLGIDIPTVQEQDTDEALRAAARERALGAATTVDGRVADRTGRTVQLSDGSGDLASALRRSSS